MLNDMLRENAITDRQVHNLVTLHHFIMETMWNQMVEQRHEEMQEKDFVQVSIHLDMVRKQWLLCCCLQLPSIVQTE